MTNLEINSAYKLWLSEATKDKDLQNELINIKDDYNKIENAFYCNLEFGTAGLRGIIGAGTNRMNIYTVAKASQGLADYVLKNFEKENRKIAISYDSRIKSDLFAKIAAETFAGNGIEVKIFDELMPTPCVSYAVRELRCAAGIMITASHNSSKYNGYKVYGADGCQITSKIADEIFEEINKLDIFNDIKSIDFEDGIKHGLISWIEPFVYTNFIENVKRQSVLFGDEIDKNVSIVYSPLNGTGLKPVLRTLNESGYTNIKVVPEQKDPDGNFTTCPYPNPEIREAMELGINFANENNADLLLATDPDCDRVGIAVKNKQGEYVLLTGNQTGILLLDFICSQRQKHDKMPLNPVMIKSIVTMDLADRVAQNYGVETINVLTGFKYIGEQIGLLEKRGRTNSFVFGFEESYGYLTGSYVRDKDAVNASFLICEMFAYYKTRGISLLDKIEELFLKYGYCLNTLYNFSFEGNIGFEKMQNVIAQFRKGVKSFGCKKVMKTNDYLDKIDGLPKDNVLKYILEDNCSVVIRPSGTEPKLKVYISVSADNKENAQSIEKEIAESLKSFNLQ